MAIVYYTESGDWVWDDTYVCDLNPSGCSDDGAVGPIYYGQCANLALGFAAPAGVSCVSDGEGGIQEVDHPQPPPPPPPLICGIELYTRPAFVNHNPGKHTYLLLDDADLLPEPDMVEGGPDNGKPIGGQLVGFINLPGEGLGKHTTHASDPTKSNNHEVGTDYTGANVCSLVSTILQAFQSYNNGPHVPYLPIPIPGTGTYNSNSFTYTLLSDVGLSGYFGSVGFAPGWGMTVPGLQP